MNNEKTKVKNPASLITTDKNLSATRLALWGKVQGWTPEREKPQTPGDIIIFVYSIVILSLAYTGYHLDRSPCVN